MKRLYKELKYRKYNEKRGEKSLEARLNFKKNKKQENRKRIGVSLPKTAPPIRLPRSSFFPSSPLSASPKNPYKDYVRIPAPEDFRLLDNTESVIDFIDQLSVCFDNRLKVFVVLSGVKKIDYCAIAVLFSIMIRFKALKIKFNGNYPLDLHCEHILRSSGFINSLYKRYEDENSYQIARENFITHASKDVVSPVTAELLENVSVTIWGDRKRCNGVQTNLIELMQNTKEHASLIGEEEKHWWLSVNHSEEEKKVSFSFVDYGVGIFKSLENKPPENKWFGTLEKMYDKFQYKDNAELLRLILNGDLHRTVTGDYFRGQGLPGLLASMQDNWFSNLHIISNDVFADVSDDKFITLKNNFSGTFVYWEINEKSKYLEATQ